MLENTKAQYQIVKELSGGNVNRPPIKQTNSRPATMHGQQMERWQERFSAVLNCPELDILYDFMNDT